MPLPLHPNEWKFFIHNRERLEHVKQVSIEIRSHELIAFFDCQSILSSVCIKRFQKKTLDTFSHAVNVFAEVQVCQRTSRELWLGQPLNLK